MQMTGIGFKIGNFILPYYGLCVAIGLVAAFLVSYCLVKRYKKDTNDLMILLATTILGAVIGAKGLWLAISYKDIEWSRILEPDYLKAIMSGGFVFYGGVIGGLIAVCILKKVMKMDVLSYINIAIPCVPVFHAFGRLGCNLVGCCYGIEYHGFAAREYTQSLIAPNGIPLFPVQLTEAIAELIIAVVLFIYVYRATEPKHSLAIYLLMYAPVRFALEYFRGDAVERKIYFWFSTSQWISIAMVVAIVGYYIYHFYRKKKQSAL